MYLGARNYLVIDAASEAEVTKASACAKTAGEAFNGICADISTQYPV